MKKHKGLAVILGASLATVYGLASVTYAITESTTIGDGLWWAFMTFTTVGYGDQYPHTVIGRLAGITLVASAVFVVLPTITAIIARSLMSNHEDDFTHEEQEEVKRLLREIHAVTCCD